MEIVLLSLLCLLCNSFHVAEYPGSIGVLFSIFQLNESHEAAKTSRETVARFDHCDGFHFNSRNSEKEERKPLGPPGVVTEMTQEFRLLLPNHREHRQFPAHYIKLSQRQ